MKLTYQDGFERVHWEDDAKGPESRPHPHLYRLQVVVEGKYDAKRGHMVAYDDLPTRVRSLLTAIPDPLNDLPGIRPTMEGLASWLREQFLMTYPNVIVRLETEGLEVECP